jgi:hypothetical protein
MSCLEIETGDIGVLIALQASLNTTLEALNFKTKLQVPTGCTQISLKDLNLNLLKKNAKESR